MSPPQPYTPLDEFPDFNDEGGAGPMKLEEDGDVLNWYQTWRSDNLIGSVSNTTPIVLSFSSPHHYQTGYKVTVLGSDVDGANGNWTITVLSATTFSLDGSTADGAGGAQGVAFASQLGIFSRLIDAAWYLGKRLLGFAYTTGVISIQGRKALYRPIVDLSDADHTIDTSMGDVFRVPAAPAAPRTITLRQSTSPVPIEGESITLITSAALAMGKQYTVTREASSQVAEFWGSGAEDIVVTAEFIFDATEYVLGLNSGGGAAGGVVG